MFYYLADTYDIESEFEIEKACAGHLGTGTASTSNVCYPALLKTGEGEDLNKMHVYKTPQITKLTPPCLICGVFDLILRLLFTGPMHIRRGLYDSE